LTCQDGQFVIESIAFYEDTKTGTELSAEADWKRRGLYLGPTFSSLDEGLQDEFEKYLQERGIVEAVASFIPEYSAYKEQQVIGQLKNEFPYADCDCRSTPNGWAKLRTLSTFKIYRSLQKYE